MERQEGEEIPSFTESVQKLLNAGAYAVQGARATMEDVHKLILWSEMKEQKIEEITLQSSLDSDISFRPSKRVCIREDNPIENTEEQATKASLFLVCDGHGGKEAAEYVRTHIFNKIMKQVAIQKTPEEAILSAFEEIESDFKEIVKEKDLDGLVGTTVTIAIIIDSTLYVANTGDSEASICTKGVSTFLTKNHSTNNPDERLRVEQEGGKLISDRTGVTRLGHPVWNPHYVNIGVTRAIGDFYFKSQEYVAEKHSGLSAVPSIIKWELTADDQFVLIASDGFWDVVNPEDAMKVILSNFNLDSSNICKKLVELSKERESKDNVTVLLIKFEGNDKNLC